MKAVILSAGSVPHEITALFRCTSVGLIPINGRPLVALQIDLLRRLGATEIKVALRHRDNRLKEYLAHYARLFAPVATIEISSDRGPGGTLLEALGPTDFSEGVLVLLGDTLIEAGSTLTLGSGNAVFTSVVQEPQRWCMVSVDTEGSVNALADKPATATVGSEAAVGCYWFGRVDASTWTALAGAPASRVEISTILEGVRQNHGLARRSTAATPTSLWQLAVV